MAAGRQGDRYESSNALLPVRRWTNKSIDQLFALSVHRVLFAKLD